MLRNLATEQTTPYHVTDLVPFKWDAKHTDPTEIANSDKQLHVIDAITAHEGNPRRKSQMTFTVKWKGYEGQPDEFTPGQPWKELRKTKALHAYLRDNNMAFIIPKEYR